MPLANLNLTDCLKECCSILLSLYAFAEKLLANGKVGVGTVSSFVSLNENGPLFQDHPLFFSRLSLSE